MMNLNCSSKSNNFIRIYGHIGLFSSHLPHQFLNSWDASWITNEDYFIYIFEGKLRITQCRFKLSSKDKQALRLTESAEKVKMELSSLTQTNIMYVAISITSFYKSISLFHIYWEYTSVFPVYLSLPPLQMAQNTLTPLWQGSSLKNCVEIY